LLTIVSSIQWRAPRDVISLWDIIFYPENSRQQRILTFSPLYSDHIAMKPQLRHHVFCVIAERPQTGHFGTRHSSFRQFVHKFWHFWTELLYKLI